MPVQHSVVDSGRWAVWKEREGWFQEKPKNKKYDRFYTCAVTWENVELLLLQIIKANLFLCFFSRGMGNGVIKRWRRENRKRNEETFCRNRDWRNIRAVCVLSAVIVKHAI